MTISYLLIFHSFDWLEAFHLDLFSSHSFQCQLRRPNYETYSGKQLSVIMRIIQRTQISRLAVFHNLDHVVRFDTFTFYKTKLQSSVALAELVSS
jgi:hypothetical protein